MPSPDFIGIETIGFIAAFFTSASFLPQAIMVIRSRQTDGLSLSMYMMFTLGIALWLTYGLVTTAWPLICANTVTITLASCILFIILQNKWKAGSLRRRARKVLKNRRVKRRATFA
jgi:MtN3 and saliva related transmembrane protein